MAPRSYVCRLPALEYWHLRLDPDWYQYGAKLDSNIYEVLEDSEALDEKGDIVCTRVARVTAMKNPIPESLRGWLGCSEFSFTMTERWWKDLFDESHPNTFTTTPPVMADRIKVSGSGWVEAISAQKCRLHFSVDVKVKVMGIGDKVATGIQDGTAKAYDVLPNRAETFYRDRSVAETAGTPAGRWRAARYRLRHRIRFRVAYRRAREIVRRARRKPRPMDPHTAAMFKVADAVREISWQEVREQQAAAGGADAPPKWWQRLCCVVAAPFERQRRRTAWPKQPPPGPPPPAPQTQMV